MHNCTPSCVAHRDQRDGGRVPEPPAGSSAKGACPGPGGRAAGTHVQGLQAVPTEGMLAVLAHHLGAAFVPLDVDLALGAAFDGRVVLLQPEPRTMGRTGVRAPPTGPGVSRSAVLGAGAPPEGPRSLVSERGKTTRKKQKLRKRSPGKCGSPVQCGGRAGAAHTPLRHRHSRAPRTGRLRKGGPRLGAVVTRSALMRAERVHFPKGWSRLCILPLSEKADSHTPARPAQLVPGLPRAVLGEPGEAGRAGRRALSRGQCGSSTDSLRTLRSEPEA